MRIKNRKCNVLLLFHAIIERCLDRKITVENGWLLEMIKMISRFCKKTIFKLGEKKR